MRIARTTTTVLEANDDGTIVRVESDDGANGRSESFCASPVSRVGRLHTRSRTAVFGKS